MIYPEYKSVEAFVEYCMDDERTSYSTEDLQKLHRGTQRRLQELRKELDSYGLTFEPRTSQKAVRGFSSNPHDRWYGKGADRSFGGSGWEQIGGWAGQEG